MQRPIVQIARMRLADIRAGDIVNGHPDDELGWFEVQEIRHLPSGELVAGGRLSTQAAKGSPWDLVGFQVVKQVEVAMREPTERPQAVATP